MEGKFGGFRESLLPAGVTLGWLILFLVGSSLDLFCTRKPRAFCCVGVAFFSRDNSVVNSASHHRISATAAIFNYTP